MLIILNTIRIFINIEPYLGFISFLQPGNAWPSSKHLDFVCNSLPAGLAFSLRIR